MSFRVLLVEDDLHLGEALRHSLQSAGYAPAWVRRANDGLAHWESGTAHAVVLDLNLPDGSGLDLLAARRRAGDTTPVHEHAWPAVLHVLSWSDFLRIDRDGNVVLDSRASGMNPEAGAVIWGQPLAPHAVRNIGTRELRIIAIEIEAAT